MKLVEFGDQVFREIGDSSLAIPSIVWWARANLGTLNSLTYNEFHIDKDTLEICGGFGRDEASIMKLLYSVFYFGQMAIRYLGAAGIQTSLSVASDGAVIKLVDRNQIAKSYLAAQKQQQEFLNNIVGAYRIAKSTPRQVASDDTSSSYLPAGYFNDLYRTKYAD